MTGLTREMVIGSRGRELDRQYLQAPGDWVKTVGQVARTGESVCLDRLLTTTGSLCEVSVLSSDPGSFAVLYHCAPARNKGEEEARERGKKAEAQLSAMLTPSGDMEEFSLVDIIDVKELQGMLDNFFALTGIGVAVVDNGGKIHIKTGWQDICTRFHRLNPASAANCLESDLELSRGLKPGELKYYKCKNNMWDIATPIIINDKKMGNLFSGSSFSRMKSLIMSFFADRRALTGLTKRSTSPPLSGCRAGAGKP